MQQKNKCSKISSMSHQMCKEPFPAKKLPHIDNNYIANFVSLKTVKAVIHAYFAGKQKF